MILVVVQARMGSSRLPGKVLREVCGRPLLALQVERMRRSRRADRILVATPDTPADQPLATLSRDLGLTCFQGSENDVLDRFYQACRSVGLEDADAVVRVTADCPLLDPDLMDEIIGAHLAGDYDYVTNTLPPSYPDGLDVEVLRFAALARAWREAELPSDREHLTRFIRRRPEQFRHHNLAHDPDLSALRWTVDQEEDLRFVTQVFEHFQPVGTAFSWRDVLALVEQRPDIAGLNRGIARNAGVQSALARDQQFLAGKETP
jgi:spore coat polysaccharide biosynthesis protein SpsF